MDELIIVGAGGHARETAAIVADLEHPPHLVGVVDDDPDARPDINGVPFLGPITDALLAGRGHVIAIGDPWTRAAVAARIGESGSAAGIIHPDATIGPGVEFGPGAIVAAGARMTTHIQAGAHVHLNPNAVVSHDCRLGDFVSCSPGVILSGEVTVGNRVLLGSGAVVLPGCRIGDDVTVGAGAVVANDIDDGVTIVGVPARPIGLRPPYQH